jgi:hypothetical protein
MNALCFGPRVYELEADHASQHNARLEMFEHFSDFDPRQHSSVGSSRHVNNLLHTLRCVYATRWYHGQGLTHTQRGTVPAFPERSSISFASEGAPHAWPYTSRLPHSHRCRFRQCGHRATYVHRTTHLEHTSEDDRRPASTPELASASGGA